MAPSPRRLPSAERAIVDATKITEYLLNASHPDNGGKARFFESLGFSAVAPMLLAAALRGQATSGEVVQESLSTHGTKYVVDGQLEAPDGRRRAVRTVWIIDAGQELPRLVTAYPRGE
jgi:hypothetical protein